MKMHHIIVLLLGLLVSTASAQVGSWDKITTSTVIRDLSASGDNVLLGTNGGILSYDPLREIFEQKIGSGVNNPDVNAVFADDEGDIWSGASSPGAIVEVLDGETGEHWMVDQVDLDAITSFIQHGDSIYATYTDGLDGGLLLFRKTDDRIQYLDQFGNFPSSSTINLSAATDVQMVGSRIAFRTEQFVIWAERQGQNLKDPTVWNVESFASGDATVGDLLTVGSELWVAVDETIYAFDFNAKHAIYEGNAHIRALQLDQLDSTAFLILDSFTCRRVAMADMTNETVVQGSGYRHLEQLGSYLILSDASAGITVHSGENTTHITFNAPLYDIFNRMLVQSNGDLVAASEEGLSILDMNGWRNIIPGDRTSILDEQLVDWNQMHVDTLDYPRHYVVEDMIIDAAEAVWLSIQGHGVLKYDPKDLSQSMFYDASSGALEPTFNSDTYVLPAQMAVDGDNNVWLTNKLIQSGGHALTVVGHDGSISHLDHATSSLSTRSAKAIAIDNNGFVWVGSQSVADPPLSGGLHMISLNDPVGEGFDPLQSYDCSYLSGSPLSSNDIIEMEVDPQNILWIVTSSGVHSMNLPNSFLNSTELRNWANLYMSEKTSDYYEHWPLTDYNVTGVEVDARGNRWFLSSNHGIHALQANGRWINGGDGYQTENSDLLDNEVFSAAFDGASGLAYFSTSKGISVLNTPFANPREDFSSIHIYPQPFKPGKHEQVIIQGLMDNSSVKILTITGALVRELTASDESVQGFEAQWDGRDAQGDLVSSGVYILYLFNEDGNASSQKLAVLK